MGDCEDDLYQRAAAGDRDALAELLKHQEPALRRNPALVVPRRWQALLSLDDVLQQTFTDAFLDFHRFVPTGEGSFEAWLTRIARCNLHDAIRALEAEKRGGDRRRVATDDGQDAFDALQDQLLNKRHRATPSRHLARAEARAELRRTLERLPETFRRVVELYDLEGRSAEQVGQVLDRSPGAAYLLRNRAHRRGRAMHASQEHCSWILAHPRCEAPSF